MFLVDLTPTDLPRSLSNLTGIEILEQAAKSLSQSYKSIEKQIKIDERELSKLNDEKTSFNQIVNFESKVKISKKRIDELKNSSNTLDGLHKISNDYSFNIDDGCFERSVSVLDKISIAQSKVSNLIKQSDSYSILKSFEILISGFADENTENVLNKMSREIDAIKIKIESNKKVLSIQNDLKNIQSEYDSIRSSGSKMSSELAILKKEISDLSTELVEYKAFLSDNNIQCEYCGNKLDV
jgi:predicted  nucleic acid-binding Zn-ribbon protein